MVAGNYNLVFDEGADLDLQLIWKDDSDTLLDLSDFEARMKLKNKVDGDVTLDWSSYVTLGGVNGTVDINVPASATINTGFLNGVYGIELENSVSGKIYKLLRGKVRIYAEVVN